MTLDLSCFVFIIIYNKCHTSYKLSMIRYFISYLPILSILYYGYISFLSYNVLDIVISVL